MAKEYVPYDGPLVTCDEAKFSGAKRYFTGLVCTKGHVEQRYVSTDQCCFCLLQWTRNWRIAHKEEFNQKRRENKDKELAQTRSWRARNHQRYKDYSLSYAKEYAKKNPEKIANNSKDWWLANPEMRRVYRERFLEKHPNHYASARAIRQARKLSAPGSFSAEYVTSLLEKQRGKCASCLSKLKSGYHVDHKMPLCLGGSNEPENIEILCPTCNMRKGGRHPDAWARKNGRLV